MRLSRASSVLLALAFLICASSFAQQKTRPPKIVFAKHAAAPAVGLAPPFGQSCRATSNAKFSHLASYRPVSIADLLGAPVALVTIRRYGPSSKNQPEIRKHVLGVLAAQTLEISPYEPWDEAAFTDIVATLQFADNNQGALEISGVHICFTDHTGAAIWMRLRPPQ
ncbi:MAG: hypothetical protein WA185_14790 [Candidatus Acidiferrales bacterium]